jgi:hypothetical protein
MMPLPVMECPCQRYLSTDNVLKVLETRAIRSRSNGDGDDELDRLVQWISGTQQLLLGNPPSFDQKQAGVVVVESHQPPCTPLHGRCRNRVPCSFRLLNDVRQACQPFIAADVVKKKPAATTSTTKRTAAVDQPAINLDSKTEFPALSSVTPIHTKSSTTKTTTTKTPGPISSVRSKKERNRIGPEIIPSSAMPVEGHSPWNIRSTHAGTTNAGTVVVDGWAQKVVGNLVNATPPASVDNDEDVLADFVKLNQPPPTNKEVLWREKSHTVLSLPVAGECPTNAGVVIDQLFYGTGQITNQSIGRGERIE